MARSQLTVTSNRDNGPGTFRWALEQTQQSPGDYEIIFAASEENSDPGHSFNTGYWTIQLQKPLPALEKGSVRVNFSSPKSVILLPAADKPLSVLPGVSNPILIVGTQFRTDHAVDVELNQINFARNTAAGGDGETGGGGGLGAGGGIAHLSGSLKIYNSVFQNLAAEGGVGSEGRKGGDSTEKVTGSIGSLSRYWVSQPGQAGGRGGLSSIPGSWINGSPSYEGSGGWPGWAGTERSLNGGDASPGYHIGQGGGSGGSGTGASAWEEKTCSFWIFGCDTKVIRKAGGNGGHGGNGAFGGGGGAAGGAGANGQPGAAGSGGFYATSGTVGSGQTSERGGQGGRGGNGAALGGAIAVIGPSSAKPAELHLHNVDFINNTANAGTGARSVSSLFVHNAKVSGSSVTLNGKEIQLGTALNNSEVIATIVREPNPEQSHLVDGFPFHEATSSVRNRAIADIRDIVLANTHGLADTNFINFEAAGSGQVGVSADLSNPDNPLHQIWRKLVPDRESEILAKYQAQIVQTRFEAVVDLVSGVLGQRTLANLNNSLVMGVSGFNPITGFGFSILSNLCKALYGHVEAAKQRDIDLEVNAKEQQDLLNFLNSQTQSKVGLVNLREERNSILIEDFTIGEDVIIIGDFGKEGPRLTVGASSINPGSHTVTISAGKNTNEPRDIVTIELSDQSNNELSESNLSATDYLATLLRRRPDQSWILGTRQSRPVILRSADRFQGGPAATDVIVDRETNGLGDQERLSIRTLSGNDQVYGSSGVESIFTSRGDDVIFPGLVPAGMTIDSVNAGPGADLVSYTSIGQSIDIIGGMKRDRSEFSQMEISLQSSSAQIAELLGVETIEAYGPSTFKYQNLPDPAANGPGFYTVRSGSGSRFEGSRFNDVVVISYDEKTNDSTAGAFGRQSRVDGKEGLNSLYLSFDRSPAGLSAQKRSGEHDFEIRLLSGLSLVEANSIQFVQIQGSDHADHFDFADSSSDFVIRGDDGDDLLRGGMGDDILVAGRGAPGSLEGQRLSGGGGKNQFWVMTGGSCYIEDFVVGQDTIVLEGYGEDMSRVTISRSTQSEDESIISDGSGLLVFVRHPGQATSDIERLQRYWLFSDNSFRGDAVSDTLPALGGVGSAHDSFDHLGIPRELHRYLPSSFFDETLPVEHLELQKLIAPGASDGVYYSDKAYNAKPLLVAGSGKSDTFIGSSKRSYLFSEFRDSVIRGGGRDDFAWFVEKRPASAQEAKPAQSLSFGRNSISLRGGDDVVSTSFGQSLDLGKGADRAYIFGGKADIVTGLGRDVITVGLSGKVAVHDFNIKKDKIVLDHSVLGEVYGVVFRGSKNHVHPGRLVISDDDNTIAILTLDASSTELLRQQPDLFSAVSDSPVAGISWPTI